MPITVTCAGCNARLHAPDNTAGKAVKCSQCAAVVPVPVADAGYEVVDAPRPVARAVAARPVRDAGEVRSARRPRAIDEDEDDDRPRRRKAKGKKKGGVPVWVFAVGGGLLLVVGVVAVVMAGFGRKVQVPGGEMLGISAPSGFSTVGDSDGGFRVYLPGQVRKNKVLKTGLPPGWIRCDYSGSNGDIKVTADSIKPERNFDSGTSPEELYALFLKWYRPADIAMEKDRIVTKTPITLDGKPALEVRVRKMKEEIVSQRDKDRLSGPPNAPPEIRKRIEESHRQLIQAGAALLTGPNRRDVYYIATDGRRMVVIQLETRDEYPSDGILNTIRESFKFQ
jgi:hypothetical protein